MNALAQRIAARQHVDQAFRECLNDGDLQSKPRVLDADRKRSAVAQQAAGTVRKLVDAFKQAADARVAPSSATVAPVSARLSSGM